jgi:hypothetical protein
MMRISTGLCLLICCAALAACTAAPRKGPDTTVSTPSVSRPPAPASAQAALSSEAFTPYAALGLSSNDGLAPGESSDALAGECMTAEGYPGANVSYAIVPGYFGSGLGDLFPPYPWGRWGYLGVADAQQYGFALMPNVPTITPADQAAAGKCGTVVRDFSNAVADGPLAGIYTLGKDISTDVQQDAAVEAATRAWSACMAKNGYGFRQPQDASSQALSGNYAVNSSLSPSAQRAQLALAVTDADCTLSSDLAGIYFAVQASYEAQLVSANQQALNAAVRQYKANYAKELSKLPALLRTTSATPDRPGLGKARSQLRAELRDRCLAARLQSQGIRSRGPFTWFAASRDRQRHQRPPGAGFSGR